MLIIEKAAPVKSSPLFLQSWDALAWFKVVPWVTIAVEFSRVNLPCSSSVLGGLVVLFIANWQKSLNLCFNMHNTCLSGMHTTCTCINIIAANLAGVLPDLKLQHLNSSRASAVTNAGKFSVASSQVGTPVSLINAAWISFITFTSLHSTIISCIDISLSATSFSNWCATSTSSPRNGLKLLPIMH